MMTSSGQFHPPAEFVKREPDLNITFDSPWPPPPLPMAMDSRPPMVKQTKRERTVFNRVQVAILEPIYQKTPYPDLFAREELALKCNLPESKIAIWFKNRRAKAKQMSVQRSSENVDSGKSVDSGSANFGSYRSYSRSPELQQNQYNQMAQPILPSYGPSFPAPRFQYIPAGPATQRQPFPLLSQYQQYAAMYARAQQYPHGYPVPGAHVSESYGQFSQPMTPATVAGPTLFDMQNDAERLIVVDEVKVDPNNITLDEMTRPMVNSSR